MNLEEQLALCIEHYNRWKKTALSSSDLTKIRKSLERAFFWLELQTAFMALHTIEKTYGNEKEVKRKLIIAKANLVKRLTEYAEEILNELTL